MGDIADLVDVENIAEKLEYLYGTKQEIADAINEVGESQGISVDSADTFRSYADKIRALGKCEVGKISVRTTPERDDEIGSCKTFEAPEGKVWKEVKVHIDAWSAVTDEVDPLIISENGYFDVNEVSAAKFDYSEVQNPTGNPKQKGYYIRINGKYYPTEDTEVDPNKTYYVKDGTKEYETASSFIINVQRQGAAPFTCEFLDEDDHVIESHGDIPYGGFCQYEGEIPVSKSGLAFQGWNPPPNNIQSNRKCHPKFYTPRQTQEEWGQSWAEIVVDHGESMPIGAWKVLPLKDDKVTINGFDISIPEIKMVKVFNGEDVSTSSFLSEGLVYFGNYCASNYSNIATMWSGNADFSADGEYNYVDSSQHKYYTVKDFLIELFKLLPDYIRQFVVPVTKYSTTMLCPGANNYSRITAMQQYMWIPSARELGATEILARGYAFNQVNMVADRGVIYSDVYTDDDSRKASYPGGAYRAYRCRELLDYSGGFSLKTAVVRNDGVFDSASDDAQSFSKVGFCL